MGLSPTSNYTKKNVSCFDIREVPRSHGKWNWNRLNFCLSFSVSNNVVVYVWIKNHATFLEIWLRNRNWCIFSQYGPKAMLQKLPSIQNSTKAQTKYFWFLNIDPMFSNLSNQSWAIFDLIVWTMISKCVESL